jgi:transcription initiation factor IIF auxiliary subunit
LFVGQKFWKWTIFIDAKPSILKEIECVIYQLHPTFLDPNKRICVQGQVSEAFPSSNTGWGEFNIDVVIEFKDGSTLTKSHFLNF